MPKEYYPLAEKEFEEAVQKHIESISIDTSVYKAPTDYIYLDENHIDLKLGRRVLLENEIYFPTGTHESRVTKISRRVNNTTDMDIECTYAVDYGRINQIESNIVDIQAAYKEQLNKDVLTVLKSWDSIDPTEYNVLSAVRTIRTIANSLSKLEKETADKYLRKDIPDTAKELETFLKGIKVIGEALVESLTVEKDSTFKGLLSSEVFTSGFPGGTGWALFWKEALNAAGVKEKKAVMELDEMTVRGVMRVYEFVISQLMGENGTRLTTDMMRVDHIDAGTKTIYLDTEKGVLYNPFRPGDILMVQRFSVDGIIKQYELQVVTAKVGDTSKGEERLDSITYKNFVGDEGSVVFRDVLTRVDSATNSDRKGVIKQTSVEEGSPYLDVLYGMKTDPDNAVRLRLGRLAGIITYWWGQLQGYGLYSNNAYLLGDFRLRTGEDVRTKFEIMEGMLQSAMQSVVNTMTEEDNFLKNASFQDDMAYWERESDMALFDIGGQLLDLGVNFYSEKNKVADIDSFDGRFMLRIKRSHIRQLNADITKPEDGSVIFLTLKYHCAEEGSLTAGFSGSAPYVEQVIPAGEGFDILEISGVWNGTGDFLLKFTGDLYIEQLTLTNHPLEDYKKEVSTKFEQTAEHILAVAEEVNKIDHTIKTAGWITTADGNKLWATIDRVDVLGNRVTTHESSFHVTAQQINAIVSRVDTIDGIISKAGWITTADGNKLWASKTLEDGGAIVSYINQAADSVTINAKHIKLEGLVTANGNVQFTTDGKIIAKNGEFSGTVVGVSGSFKSLNCVNNDGDIVGGISFGSDGKMWFNGDLYHQGYDYDKKRSFRFYTSDVWCRGNFGARQRNTLVVYGSYGYYYVNGLETETGKVYVSLSSATSSNNETYYTIPLYGSSGDAAGFPVDLVIIKVSGTYRYLLSGMKSQRVTVMNANNQNSEVYIYSNGNKVKWPGGTIADCRNIEDFMSPVPASNLLGRGWIVGSMNDNDW